MALSRPVRWVFRTLLLLLVLAAGGVAWVWWQLNGSLAPLDGELSLSGLNDRVSIERDAQGIPTIEASNRPDTAFALGVLHAQERYFQMDLLRRNSAGELAALVGPVAANYDQRIRLHQFRKRAQRAVAAMDTGSRRVLDAYTQGVNAGLNALSSPPFEYRLLRVQPEPWQAADSILTLYSMYLDLQPEWNERERSLAVMKDLLPADWYEFLTPRGGRWDAPVEGEAYRFEADFPQTPLTELQSGALAARDWEYRDEVQLGSNNWSASGDRTAYGAGMVSNDMHLGLNVPNIWYRASWILPGGDQRRVTGATLPGAPAMVVGSNQHIAWGFTNSNGDYHDSITLQTNAEGSEYLTPDGWEPFRVERESVDIKGGEPVEVDVRLTRWGPVIGEDHLGNLTALRWVAHDVEGANLNLIRMEKANTVYEALDVAAVSGVPGQNLNVVDDRGNQAWTIMGRLPRRFGFEENGFSAEQPSDWSAGNHGWNGYLSAAEYPRIVNPEPGRLWTANARIVDGQLDRVGWGGYALGARQQQIRDDLFALETFTEQDFLDIMLDDRAVFLERWQRLMLAVLDEETLADRPPLNRLHDQVENWQGRASKTSVGYRIVKRYRERVIDQTVGPVYDYLANASNAFWPGQVDNFLEYPVWALVNQQPERHLPEGFASWDDFMVRMAVDTLTELTQGEASLSDRTWGEANRLDITHPLSGALPTVLSNWLNMPAEPMDGDTYMPRVQSPDSGASERMVVAPGHEENGIFHMATGQSGHPLSSYYDRGHRDWVEGRPSRFLPGPTEWSLLLVPGQ
ncbi:penicillin acylase family protein [Saccharospirillum salsuginis]|uniref:Penicillin acylase n=1 Tax=Saccharospirillum salsuginis TaxID=418750 RepID=A0A918K3S0_9GAMM|nr:penicillin acylase family protein [Saccharospirillum salsuginis]GGX44581.1 penicillin acylase [Saccharospirillum salsuginis]